MSTVEAFITEVNKNLRQALFRKLQGTSLSQDQITQLVASSTQKAMEITGIREFAELAEVTTPVLNALAAVDPSNEALSNFASKQETVSAPIRDVYGSWDIP